MNLVFYGAQKENMDSAEFFCKLEELNVDYTVDCRTGEIGINNIEISQRKKIVQKINEFYDVDYIVSRKKPMELTSFEFETVKSRDDEHKADGGDTEFESEIINESLNALKRAFIQQGLSSNTVKRCITDMITDIKVISKNNKRKFENGEILSCDFGFGVRAENSGRFWVVVLQKTLDSKYLVVPVNFTDQYEYEDTFSLRAIKDVDFVHYNITYQRKIANVYLNRIQEVDRMRLGVIKGGKVTKRFLRKIYQSLSLMKGQEEELSLNQELEDLARVAVWHCAKKETVPEQAEYLFEILQIPQEYIFLRSALSIALSTKITVLKTIVSMIGEDHEYSLYKIKTRLREEFVTWFEQIYPDIFEKYEKISLADFLKAILKMLEERKK